MTRRLVCALFCAAGIGSLLLPSSAPAAAGPSLTLTTFLTSDLPLGQIVWTGSRFLYVAEGRPTLGKIESSDAAGHNVTTFASFEQGGEEMRCVPAPEKPAYWPKGIYCHTPDNRILRVSLDGSTTTQLAALSVTGNSDGALVFDTSGRYGYALLAASGGSGSDGGQVFAIRRSGQVQTIGSYPGPGGAENAVIAPATFGSAAGELLLSLDPDGHPGGVVAIDRKGNVRTIASGLGNGLNPIILIEPAPAKRGAGLPAAGAYLADTTTQKVYFAPAAQFRRFTGSILVGTELTGQFWVIRAKGSGFETLPVTTNLPAQAYNFEGSTYIP